MNITQNENETLETTVGTIEYFKVLEQEDI